MYTINQSSFGRFTNYRLSCDRTKNYIDIIPEFGAHVLQIGLPNPLLETYHNDQELMETKGSKGIKLIPYPNRIKDGKYNFNNREYQFHINKSNENNSIHGIIHNKPFAVKESIQNANNAGLSLEYTIEGEKGYPFKVNIQIHYLLNNQGFTCKTIFKNLDISSIPIGDGWHPYFSLGNVDNLRLQIPPSRKMEVDDRMIPTGWYSKFDKFKKPKTIGKQIFDTGFELDSRNVKTLISNGTITIEIWQKNYPYLQIYIPPHRESIAIEPMTCAANAFNNKKGLITLHPNQTFEGEYGIKLI